MNSRYSLGPFDDDHRVALEDFVQADLLLISRLQPVEIHMVQYQTARLMTMDQGETGALHLSRVDTQPSPDGFGQPGFSCTQLALKKEDLSTLAVFTPEPSELDQLGFSQTQIG